MSKGRLTLSEYLRQSKAVQALLAIDLGNSRTGVVVVDQVNQVGHVAKTYTDIQLDGRNAFKESQPGPFDSLVACIVDDESFVCIGGHARQVSRAFDGKTGEKSLSSPKRYFFDVTPSRTDWCAGISKGQKNAFESEDLIGELADSLARRYGCVDAKKLPCAGLLGGMVVELYVQAVRYVGSESFKKKTNDNRLRFISHVHVTYPTTLTSDERLRYKLQIDKALRVHAARGNAEVPFVEVRSDADEATAVLGHFAQREIVRVSKNVPAWLATLGRRVDNEHYKARVAVIDIGGGTTDLSIADILAQGTGKAEVHQLFLDGINLAGDDVIEDMVKNVLFEKVAKAVIGSAGNINNEQFKGRYNEFVEHNTGIIRSLVAVAVKALLHLHDGGSNADIKLAETPEDKTNFVNLRKKIITGDPEDGWADSLKITLTEQDRIKIRKRLENVLLPVLEVMGQEIAVFECDALVVSGKITSVTAVKDLLARCVPIPPWAVINMNSLTSDKEDVKFATACGGAQAALHALGATNTGFHIAFSAANYLSSGYRWGYTTNLDSSNQRINVAFENALEETDGTVSLPYENHQLYLLRQRAGGWGMVAASHLIVKRDLYTPVVGTVFITLSVKDERVCIIEVSGGYSVSDFECSVYGFPGGKHWMDHGRIE